MCIQRPAHTVDICRACHRRVPAAIMHPPTPSSSSFPLPRHPSCSLPRLLLLLLLFLLTLPHTSPAVCSPGWSSTRRRMKPRLLSPASYSAPPRTHTHTKGIGLQDCAAYNAGSQYFKQLLIYYYRRPISQLTMLISYRV